MGKERGGMEGSEERKVGYVCAEESGRGRVNRGEFEKGREKVWRVVSREEGRFLDVVHRPKTKDYRVDDEGTLYHDFDRGRISRAQRN